MRCSQVILLSFFLAFCSSNTWCQAKLKDIYPQQHSFKRKFLSNNWELNNGLGRDLNECLSGNCKSGQGTKLVTDWEQGYGKPDVLAIAIYEGAFAANGTEFIGKVWELQIPYTSKDGHMTPSLDINLADAGALQSFLGKEGTMKLEGGKAIVINGQSTAPFLAPLYRYLKRTKTLIREGKIAHIDMLFNDTSDMVSYSGKLADNVAAYFGTAQYKDGTKYEGFFFQNVFFGPGIYTRKDGTVRQGIWMHNNLIVDTPVGNLQKYLDPSVIPHQSSTDYSWKVLQPPPDGWAMVQTTYQMLYGYWKGGQLNGASAIIPLNNLAPFGNELPIWWGATYKEGIPQYGLRAWGKYEPKQGWSIAAGPIKKLLGYYTDAHKVDSCGMQLRHRFLPYYGWLTEEVKGRMSRDLPDGWCSIRNIHKPGSEKLAYLWAHDTYTESSDKVPEWLYSSMATGHSNCYAYDPASKDKLLSYFASRIEKSTTTSTYTPPKPVATADHPCPGSENSKVFPKGTRKSSGKTDYIVVGYDCGTNKIICLKREYTDGKNTFFKSDVNIGFYSVVLVHLTLAEFMSGYGSSEKVAICPVCTGTGVVQEEVIRSRGGTWEQVNFNISVYTPYHEIARWTERAKCPKCNHTGLLPK